MAAVDSSSNSPQQQLHHHQDATILPATSSTTTTTAMAMLHHHHQDSSNPPTAVPLALPAPPLPLSSATPSPLIVTPSTATATPSSNPRRLPPPCWSHDETVALIDSYRDKWYSLRRGNLKATHWQEVAESVGRRCPAASPPKTAVQCRHKMEKLRKRYRTEIQRARSMPVSRFSSSWVHFKRMDAMEKGPVVKKRDGYNSDENDNDNDNEEEDEEEEEEQDYSHSDGYAHIITSNVNNHNYNGSDNANARNIQKFYRSNGIGIGFGGTSSSNTPSYSGNVIGVSGGGFSGNAGFRIRIPTGTGVSVAQPGPKMYPPKFEQKYGGPPIPNYAGNSTPNVKPNVNNMGSSAGMYGGARMYDSGRSGSGSAQPVKREREREKEPMAEMVAAIKMLGDGFVRMEQMKMEMAREIETMRMDMEMKRTEMILDSQHQIVEAFAKAVSEKRSNKKPRRIPSSES